jgi:drug/metabolite transporter (DMT)-like permease
MSRTPQAATLGPATTPAWSGIMLAMLGAVAFSGKAIIVKLAYRYGVDAVTLIMYRMLFAAPFYAVLAWWAGRGKPPLERRDWWALLGLGFSGYYLASLLDFAGLQYVSASLERLILYLNPTIVLAMGLLLFGKKVGRQQLLAVVVSYAGVLIAFGHEAHFQGNNALLGAALIFGSAVSYAMYLVFSGQLVQRLGAMRLVGWTSLIACAFCIGHFLVLRPLSSAVVAPQVITLSVLNAALCTVAPTMLVMMAIERIGAATAAQTGMVGPMSTLLMSVFILGEPFTPWIAAGTVLVLAGVGLLARQRQRLEEA